MIMSFYVVSGLYSFLANLAIGLFVFFKNPRNSVNVLFALFSLMVSGWSVGTFLENVTADKQTALWVLRANYVFAVWLPSIYVHFVYAWTGTATKVDRIKLKAGYLASILFTPFVFSPWFIPRLQLIAHDKFFISFPGPLYYLFFLFFSAGMCEVLAHTIFRLNQYSGNQRTQIKYLTLANAIAIFAGFEYFSRVFGLLKSPPLDDYILVIYLLVLAYAIVRHQLLDIQVIIKRTFIFSVILTSALAAVSILAQVIQWLIGRYFGLSESASTIASAAVLVGTYGVLRIIGWLRRRR